MTFDSAMLAAGEARYRLYRWRGAAVTLGRSQVAEQVLAHPDGILWAKRPTGGGAVLHGHDLTLSLVVGLEGLGLDGKRLGSIYEALTLPLVSGFARLGVGVGRGSGGGPAADCFASAGPYDLVEGSGRKVAGCAMRVTRGSALLQASLPVERASVRASSVIVGGVDFEPALFGFGFDELASVLEAEIQAGIAGVRRADRGF